MTNMNKAPVTEADIEAISVAPRITIEAIENNILMEHYYTAYDGAVGGIVHEGRTAVEPSVMDGGSSEARPEGDSPKAVSVSEEPTGQDLNHIPEFLKLTTICSITLRNGFTVHGTSACASPENFNAELGKRIAREQAINQIGTLMAYELRSKLSFSTGLNDPLGNALTHMLADAMGNDDAFTTAHADVIFGYMQSEDERIARIAHEVNRVWCEMNGDMSQPTWLTAPQWQKQSAINGVEFHRNNPNAGDSASHDNWMAEKVKDGWIYGPVKNPEQKVHPCIVPFDQLPAVQQFKDRLFRTIVHAALNTHNTEK